MLLNSATKFSVGVGTLLSFAGAAGAGLDTRMEMLAVSDHLLRGVLLPRACKGEPYTLNPNP